MSENPRENAKGKGFWDGGSKRHGRYSESAGKATGVPGPRRTYRTGVRIDLEAPVRSTENEPTAAERDSPAETKE